MVETNKLNEEDIRTELEFFGHSVYWFHAFKPTINGEQQKGHLYSEFCNKDKVIKLCKHFNGKGILCVAVNERPKDKTKATDVNKITTLLFDVDVKKEGGNGVPPTPKGDGYPA